MKKVTFKIVEHPDSYFIRKNGAPFEIYSFDSFEGEKFSCLNFCLKRIHTVMNELLLQGYQVTIFPIQYFEFKQS